MAETIDIGLTIDADTRRVIQELASCDDDYRPFVRTIARDIEMPVEKLRGILHQLGKHGLATYGPVVDEDSGRPNGSTWWLTDAGIAMRGRLNV